DVFDFPQMSPLHRYLIAKNLASAELVCSTSHVMAQYTSQYYSGDIFITPFGVDCAQFSPDRVTIDDSEFVVGTIKSLEDKYGIDYLIRAFAIVKAQYTGKRKLRLVIGGEGSKQKDLKELASSCGISRETTFLGFVPHKDVPRILNTFSAFVAL